jgi:hypothetical protein
MFFKKGRGALWVCIWNRGGGGPKKFGNRCTRATKEIPLVFLCLLFLWFENFITCDSVQGIWCGLPEGIYYVILYSLITTNVQFIISYLIHAYVNK